MKNQKISKERSIKMRIKSKVISILFILTILLIALPPVKSYAADKYFGLPVLYQDHGLDPSAVALDSQGNLYVADAEGCRILKVDKDKRVTAIAGKGTSGDLDPAIKVDLNYPSGVAVDSEGNIYIADTENNCIREINKDLTSITTIAGKAGKAVLNECFRDNELATSALLWNPRGLAIDSAGNIYIADTYNNRIRKIDKNTKIITTIAGTGGQGYSGDGVAATSSELEWPTGVTLDSAGNIYIADMFNNRIRKIDKDTTIITTIAGTGTVGSNGEGELATKANLNSPKGVAVASNGNIYIADTGNHLIRKIDKDTKKITTIEGASNFNLPTCILLDSDENFYVGDAEEHYRVIFFNKIPTIESVVQDSNTQITLKLSEACKNITNANGGGFAVQGTITSKPYAISKVEQGSDASHIVLTVADMSASGYEGVTIKYTAGEDGTITDTTNVSMETDAVGVQIAASDTTSPTIAAGAAISDNNAYVDVTFSEGIYGVGSTALTKDKLKCNFAANGGNSNTVTIKSIKKTNSADESIASNLSGGETTVRVFLNIEKLTSAANTIEIMPIGAAAVYDKAGNAMAASQTTGGINLKNQSYSAAIESSAPFTAGQTIKIKLNMSNFSGSKDVTIKGVNKALDNTYGSINGTTSLNSDSEVNGQIIPVNFIAGTATIDLILNKAADQDINFIMEGTAIEIPIKVVAGVAKAMTIITDITAPPVNGGLFGHEPSLRLKDAYGNICAEDNSTVVTVAKKDTGTWNLTGTLTQTALGGTVTFGDLKGINTAEVDSAQLSFTAPEVAELSSGSVTIGYLASGQSVTLEVNNNKPDIGDFNMITLTVKDSAGKSDTTLNGDVTVTLYGVSAAPNGTYGSFDGTELTSDSLTVGQKFLEHFQNGQMSASFYLNNAAAQNIYFKVNGVKNDTTSTLTITPVANKAKSMSITTDITAPPMNGGQFGNQPIIILKDKYGNVCMGDSSTEVTVAKKDTGAWNLKGTLKQKVVNGVATFTDLGGTNSAVVNNAQLSFIAAGLEVDSSTVTIGYFAHGQSAEAVANTLTPVVGASNAITLTVKDSINNIDTTFDGDKFVTIYGTTAAPDGTYGSFNGTALTSDSVTTGQKISVHFTKGAATPELILNKAAAQNISFNIDGLIIAGTNTLNIIPTVGNAISMKLTTDITAPTVNGGMFGNQPVITIKDAYGNICTGDNSTEVTAAKKDNGDWNLTGNLTKKAVNGVVTFTDIGGTNVVLVNNAQLSFTTAGLTEVTSSTVTMPMPVPSTTASGINDIVNLSFATVTAGDTVTITAVGDRQGENGTVIGDERYIPTTWTSTESGKTGNFTLSGASYTSAYPTSIAGNYTVKASYKKQTWNGTDWLDNDPKVTDSKTIDLTVNAVIPNSSTITPTTANFDKYANAADYKDVKALVNLNGNTLTAIKNGGVVLNEGTDYTTGSSITIKKEYLGAQPTGTTNLTFQFSAGGDRTLGISIADSTPIPNQNQNAPIGLIGIAPTSSANNNGKITGTSTVMEYKSITAQNYIAVTGNEINGLSPGTYKVRYAAKSGFNAGEDATVVVDAYVTPPAPPYIPPYIPPYVPPYTPPQPQNETRGIPVVIENGEKNIDAGQLTVTRSTDGNGMKKDYIALEGTQTTEILKKVLETKKDTVDMVVTDVSGNNADSVEVQVSKDAMAGFAENNLNLGLETEKAKLKFPKETVMSVKDADIQLTIGEVKDTKEIAKTNALLQQMSAGAQRVGTPVNVESNAVYGTYQEMSSRTTTVGGVSVNSTNAAIKLITLPIKSSDVPQDKSKAQEFINSLAILVQHSDGENRLQKGTIEYDKNGNPTGLAIWVDKFSTFTLVKTNFDGKVNTISEKQNPDKVWNIQFTKEVDPKTVTEDNIYILDSKGSKVEVELKNSGKNLTIKPVKNYNLGETYTLYISKNLSSKSGKLIKQAIKYEFTIGNTSVSGDVILP
jgi:hypothetical protein